MPIPPKRLLHLVSALETFPEAVGRDSKMTYAAYEGGTGANAGQGREEKGGAHVTGGWLVEGDESDEMMLGRCS